MERLNCVNLDGIDNVPEKMKPIPSQKPNVVTKLVENSEEIRLTIAELIHLLIDIVPPEHFIS